MLFVGVSVNKYGPVISNLGLRYMQYSTTVALSNTIYVRIYYAINIFWRTVMVSRVINKID